MRPQMTHGCWATKRKCSFERTRLGSLGARILLSIFGGLACPVKHWTLVRHSVLASAMGCLDAGAADETRLDTLSLR